jgi:hypothetical protein
MSGSECDIVVERPRGKGRLCGLSWIEEGSDKVYLEGGTVHN